MQKASLDVLFCLAVADRFSVQDLTSIKASYQRLAGFRWKFLLRWSFGCCCCGRMLLVQVCDIGFRHSQNGPRSNLRDSSKLMDDNNGVHSRCQQPVPGRQPHPVGRLVLEPGRRVSYSCIHSGRKSYMFGANCTRPDSRVRYLHSEQTASTGHRTFDQHIDSPQRSLSLSCS